METSIYLPSGIKTDTREKYEEKVSRTITTLYSNTELGEKQAQLAEAILKGIRFKTIRENDQIYWYDVEKGYWNQGGEIIIREICLKINSTLTRHFINEVIDKIRTWTYIYITDLNPPNIIVVKNGVLIFKGEKILFEPHNPKFLAIQAIPVDYDENAFCATIEQAMFQWTTPDNKRILEEAIGYCLLKEYPYHSAFMLFGPTHSGKSTCLRLFKTFLGIENVAAVTLQKLAKSDFYVNKLFGKLANISPDLPSKAIYNTGLFKALTGEDTVTANIKFGKIYEFENYAKLFFSTNEIPASAYDESDAYYGRWIIIDFPHQFLEENKDPQLLAKMSTKKELSGFLNMALDGLIRLRKRGQLEKIFDLKAKKQAYIMGSDTVKAFIYEKCNLDSQEWIRKDEIYEEYEGFCYNSSRAPKKKNAFARKLKEWTKGKVHPDRIQHGSRRIKVFRGITFKSG
ncbi:MAG: DNA primase family protein [Candidatus Hodarchaeales archaeon]|jgi:putative DNA primase/helicase